MSASPSSPPGAPPSQPSPPIAAPSSSGDGGRDALPAQDRAAGLVGQEVPEVGAGAAMVVPGSTGGTGQGALVRVRVEVEDGLPVDGAAFAGFVMSTLTDPRGWSREGWDFVRTDGDADVVVTLDSPATSARRCAPLVTRGELSCRTGDDVVLTLRRWALGADAYGTDREGYRRYLVSHEVGHFLGKGHVGCPGPGRAAPTMMQQSKGVGQCAAQPWPYPQEPVASSG